MSKFIALFPLNVILLPGERMRLHIFEPRYKQLINECVDMDKNLGIPFVRLSKLTGTGSEVRVSKVINHYANGEMDIEIEGVKIFQLMDFQDPFPGKLYAGGNTLTIENIDVTDENRFVSFVRTFYRSVYEKPIASSALDNFKIFDVALLLNLNHEQKFELLHQDSQRAKINFLVHQMRFLLLVKDQEKKLNNNFLLN